MMSKKLSVRVNTKEYEDFAYQVLVDICTNGYIKGFLSDQIKVNSSIDFNKLDELSTLKVDFSKVINQVVKIDLRKGEFDKFLSKLNSKWAFLTRLQEYFVCKIPPNF